MFSIVDISVVVVVVVIVVVVVVEVTGFAFLHLPSKRVVYDRILPKNDNI